MIFLSLDSINNSSHISKEDYLNKTENKQYYLSKIITESVREIINKFILKDNKKIIHK